jgi:DNA-binding transcriptional ArsR family regulator
MVPHRMDDATDIASVAALLADSSRSTMLQALMDQRARTAGELARLAKIAPSTASQHLARLSDSGLLAVEAQGRHRYYRLAGPKVAALLESMMAFAPASVPIPPPRVGFDLRFARTCYDHLAGTIATALYDRLRADGTLHVTSDGIALTSAGARRLQTLGIDTETLRAGRRPLARARVLTGPSAATISPVRSEPRCWRASALRTGSPPGPPLARCASRRPDAEHSPVTSTST